MVHPTSQKGKEGTKVEFRCEARGKRKITYQWLKDRLKLPVQTNSSLVFDSVKPRDFGCYCCEVRCSDGQNKSEPVMLLSRVATLDVLPREGMSKYHACIGSILIATGSPVIISSLS